MSTQQTLGEKQREFAIDIANLIVYAYSIGYEVTFGEAYRTDEQSEINAMGAYCREQVATMIGSVFKDLAAFLRNNGNANGIRNSLHQQRLAIDLNLFKHDEYIADGDFYRPLGEYFKSLREGNCWGGDWGDGNHFSRTHGGRK